MSVLRALKKALRAFARLCDEQRKALRARRGGTSHPTSSAASTNSSTPPAPRRRSTDPEDPFADLIEAGEKMAADYASLAAETTADLPPELRPGATPPRPPPPAAPAPSSPTIHAGEAPREAAPVDKPAAEAPADDGPAWTVTPPTDAATPPARTTKLAQIIKGEVARRREAKIAASNDAPAQ